MKDIIKIGLLIFGTISVNAYSKEINYTELLYKDLILKSHTKSEIEFICSEPSNNIDCRNEGLKAYDFKEQVLLRIKDITVLDRKYHYKVEIENNTYYIPIEKVLHNLNENIFYESEKDIKDFNQKNKKLDYYLGKKYEKKNKVDIYVCKNELTLNDCEDGYIFKDKEIELKEVKVFNERNYLKLKNHKELYIEEFVFKILFK